jgi:hypothetical protein
MLTEFCVVYSDGTRAGVKATNWIVWVSEMKEGWKDGKKEGRKEGTKVWIGRKRKDVKTTACRAIGYATRSSFLARKEG